MTKIALDKAQHDLPALIKRVLAGEEIVIAVDDKLVKLAPMPGAPLDAPFDEVTARRRGYGAFKGQFELPDSFFEPLPDEELAQWEGRGSP